jgi:hypothetical protein
VVGARAEFLGFELYPTGVDAGKDCGGDLEISTEVILWRVGVAVSRLVTTGDPTAVVRWWLCEVEVELWRLGELGETFTGNIFGLLCVLLCSELGYSYLASGGVVRGER